MLALDLRRSWLLMAAVLSAAIGSTTVFAQDSGFFALSACAFPRSGAVMHGFAAAGSPDAAMLASMTRCSSTEPADTAEGENCCRVVLPSFRQIIPADLDDRRCIFAYGGIPGGDDNGEVTQWFYSLGSDVAEAQESAKSECDWRGFLPRGQTDGPMEQYIGVCVPVGRTCLGSPS